MESQSLFGWLSPSGKFFQTGMYNHVADVGKIPELKALIPWYDERADAVEHTREYCNNLSRQGEHPEWHCYEMAHYDFQTSVVKALYERGCLRVGDAGSGTLAFEGMPNVIKSMRQTAIEFAQSHNMDAEFEPIVERKPKRY